MKISYITMSLKFFFPYIGNKWNESKKIYDTIKLDDIETIVEPFCGSCAFSIYGALKMNIKNKKYEFNDIDEHLIEFLKEVKEGKLKEYIEHCNTNAQQYYDNIKLWQKENRDNKFTDLFNWFTKKKLSRGHLLKGFNYKNDVNKSVEIDYKKYDKHEKFFMSDDVSLTCSDYTKILEKYKNDEKALLFLDPPYIDSYNALYCGYDDNKHSYEKDNTRMYVDIINFLKTCKCRVVMVISVNALTKYLYDGYIIATYDKIYQLTKKKTIHMIIYNGQQTVEQLKKIKVKRKSNINKSNKIEIIGAI